MPKNNSTPAIDRFWSKIKISETKFYKDVPCWEWTGYIHPLGYGQFRPDTKKPQTSPHRFAYEHFVGKITQDREVDHLCGVKHCANPKHLELVSRQENLSRRNRRYSRICPKHNEEKIPIGKKRSSLRCRSCGREQVAAYYEKQKRVV